MVNTDGAKPLSSSPDLRKKLCRFYFIAALHMIIPMYGAAILVFQCIPTWRLTKVHESGHIIHFPEIIKDLKALDWEAEKAKEESDSQE